MSLKITWKEGPLYPVLIKGVAVGVINGRLMVAGGMSPPGRELEYGFLLATEDTPKEAPSAIIPGKKIESPLGSSHPLPPMPTGPGWTSGAAVAGRLAVEGGRRRAVGNKAIAEACWAEDPVAPLRMWRTTDYKYVESQKGDSEFYDLVDDPEERNNRIDDLRGQERSGR